jgi:hypothetical protein
MGHLVDPGKPDPLASFTVTVDTDFGYHRADKVDCPTSISEPGNICDCSVQVRRGHDGHDVVARMREW